MNSGQQHAPTTGLILSDNMIAGYQVAHLLSSAYGWNMQVLRRDKQAYFSISEGHIQVVVADIDRAELGGLAVLAYTKRHWPSVTAYAITRNEDAYIKQLAQDMGGCQAFFYLTKHKPGLDMQRGLAFRISDQVEKEKRSRLDTARQPIPDAVADDQPRAFFALLKRNQQSEETPDEPGAVPSRRPG